MNNFIIISILKRHEEKNNYLFAESKKRDSSLKNRMSKESSRGNYLTHKKMVSAVYPSLMILLDKVHKLKDSETN